MFTLSPTCCFHSGTKSSREQQNERVQLTPSITSKSLKVNGCQVAGKADMVSARLLHRCSRYACVRSEDCPQYSRSRDAAINVYDEAANVIEAQAHKGDFKAVSLLSNDGWLAFRPWCRFAALRITGSAHIDSSRLRQSWQGLA
jgi:hypothetical protein